MIKKLKIWILNWLGVFAQLDAFVEKWALQFESMNEKFRSEVRELHASTIPYVIVTGKLKYGDKFFPYSVGAVVEADMQDSFIFRHLPYHVMKVEKIELFDVFGSGGYEIYDIMFGNVSMLQGVWPSGKPWTLEGDEAMTDVGNQISVRVRRVKS